MWEIISQIISGVISPLTNMTTAIFNKKEDTILEKFKVDGTVDIALIQAQAMVIQTQAQLLNNRFIVMLQVLFGLPTALYYSKCLVYDKVLGWGSTDPLGGDISTWAMWIVGFLFLHTTIVGFGRKT